MLGADLLAKPYMAVGDFFKNLSDSDLDTLLKSSEPETQESMMDDILLITMMLRGAEGLEQFTNIETSLQNVEQLITMLVLESLHRKGLVKLNHENMSFGEDMGDKIVVEKL
jgi:hypothetical protein